MGIAEAAVAAAQQDHPLAGFGQVGDHFFAVLGQYLGADRQLHDHAFARAAGAVLAHAVMADLGLEMLLIAEIDQGVEIGDAFDDDIAAASAVAAVGAAVLDVFLTTEADGACAALTALDENLGLIEKLHGVRRGIWKTRDSGNQKRGMADHSPFFEYGFFWGDCGR